MKSIVLAGVCLLAACAQPIPGPVPHGRWSTVSAQSLTMCVAEDVETLSRRLRQGDVWREEKGGRIFTTDSGEHHVTVEVYHRQEGESRVLLRVRRRDGRAAHPATLAYWQAVVKEGIKP